MGTSPSPASHPLARLTAVVLFLLLLAGAAWLGADLWAQQPPKAPPKEEEEEPAKTAPKRAPKDEEEESTKPKRKVIRVDDDPPPKGGDPSLSEGIDLVTAARTAKHTDVQRFLSGVAVAHDIIITLKGVEYRIRPVEEYLGNPPRYAGRIKFRLLDRDFQDDKAWEAAGGDLSGARYYEQTVQKRVDEFLQRPPLQKPELPRAESLRVCRMALAAALSFHQSARERGKRRGDEFEAIETSLRQKLMEVEMAQLQLLVDAGDWDNAFAQARRLADAYPKPEDQQKIAGPLARVIGKAVEGGNYKDDQLRELQKRMRQLEEQFPTSIAPPQYHEKLREQAQRLFDRAKGLVATKDNLKKQQALELVKQAEEVWPRLPGLHDFRLELENATSTLRVGVRDLPVLLAPGVACTDSEKQAVELLFEGLVQASCDPDGTRRYTTGLAEGKPVLLAAGRQFQLARDAYWSNDKPVTAEDVRATVRLLKNKNWSGFSPAWAELVEDAQGGDRGRVSLLLQQGFLDPLALMTFKVLPKEPWPDSSLTPADETRFAKEPVGSGPYVLGGKGKTMAGRDYVSFVASPNYGTRAARAGLPHIREIQFFRSDDMVSDLKGGHVDLVADLPSDRVKAAQESAAQNVKVLPPMQTRRIHFLAVNHRHPALQSVDLRKALAHAIQRDKILDEVFRGGLGEAVHRPLTGPFPPGSWACDPNLVYKAGLSKTLVEKAGLKNVKLTLKFPNNDQQAAKAMDLVRKQVLDETGVELQLEPLEPHDLRAAVETTHRYDLAYYSYDFPGGSYWLWPLFDPNAAGEKGTNYLGYQNDGLLEAQFRQVMGRRDPREVQKLMQTLHGMLFERMPLIPLWQLDRHVALHPDLETGPFDPLLVFGNVENWRLQKK